MIKVLITELAAQLISKLDSRTGEQIVNKIDLLREQPEKRGKQLTGDLASYRSFRAAGQKNSTLQRRSTMPRG